MNKKSQKSTLLADDKNKTIKAQARLFCSPTSHHSKQSPGQSLVSLAPPPLLSVFSVVRHSIEILPDRGCGGGAEERHIN